MCYELCNADTVIAPVDHDRANLFAIDCRGWWTQMGCEGEKERGRH